MRRWARETVDYYRLEVVCKSQLFLIEFAFINSKLETHELKFVQKFRLRGGEIFIGQKVVQSCSWCLMK